MFPPTLPLFYQQENRDPERKATSQSRPARLSVVSSHSLPGSLPGPQLPSAYSSTTRQCARLREGLVSLHPRQSLLPDGLFSFRMEGISKNNATQNSCPHPLLRPPAVQAAHLHITGSTHLPIPIPEGKTAGMDTEPRCMEKGKSGNPAMWC